MAFAAACGGGGGTHAAGGTSPVAPVVPVVPPSPTPAPVTGSAARFVLKIPAKSGASFARVPKYVASNTAAIRFTLLTVNGAPTGNPPGNIIALDSTVCTTNSDGSKSCSISVSAPVGSDDFSVETFADTAGTQRVGSGIVNVQVALNSTNTTGMTLSGALDHVALLTNTTYFGDSYYYYYYYSSDHRLVRGTRPVKGARSAQSSTTSTRLYLVAFDAQNNVILDPTAFATPITLGVSRPDAIQLTVTHQDGSSGGSTAAAPVPSQSATPMPTTSWPTVSVTSVSDVVTASLVSGWMNPWTVQPYYSTYQDWPVIGEIAAWIGSPGSSIPTPPSFSYYYSPQYNVGQQLNTFYPYQLYTLNVANTSSPPSPCAPGYVQYATTAGACTTPYISFTAADTATSQHSYGAYNYGYYTFTSQTDTSTPTFNVTTNDINFSGTYTLTVGQSNGSACPTATLSGTTLRFTQNGGRYTSYCYYTIANGEASATFYVYQGTPYLQWTSNDGRVTPSGYSVAHLQFASPNDTAVVTVYFSNSDSNATSSGSGGPTFMPDPAAGNQNVQNCQNNFVFVTSLSPTNAITGITTTSGWSPTSTTSAGSAQWSFNVSLLSQQNGGPTAAVTCKLIVVGNGSSTTYDGMAASLEIDVNNLIGGTIQ